MSKFVPDDTTFNKMGVEKEVISVRKLGQKNKDKDNKKEVNKVDINPVEYEPVPTKTDTKTPKFNVSVLPSGFYPYPNQKKETVNIKPYDWQAVKFLRESKLTLIEEWNFILEHIETSFEKKLLTLQDFFYLALKIRMETVGSNKFDVTVNCKNKVYKNIIVDGVQELHELECSHPNTYTLFDKQVGYDDLKIKDNEVLEIEVLDKWYQFTPMTIKDAEFLHSNGLFGNSNAQIAVQCRNADFDIFFEILEKEKIDLIQGQNLESIEYIFYHGILPVTEQLLEDITGDTKEPLVCEKCKQNVSVFLDGGGTIIRPFRKSGLDTSSGVRFSTKVKSEF